MTDLQQSGRLTLHTGYRNERASARLLYIREETVLSARLGGDGEAAGRTRCPGCRGIVGRRLKVWSALERRATSGLNEAAASYPLGT